MKNASYRLIIRLNTDEERIGEFEVRSIEIFQPATQKDNNGKEEKQNKTFKNCGTLSRGVTYLKVIGIRLHFFKKKNTNVLWLYKSLKIHSIRRYGRDHHSYFSHLIYIYLYRNTYIKPEFSLKLIKMKIYI